MVTIVQHVEANLKIIRFQIYFKIFARFLVLQQKSKSIKKQLCGTINKII